MKRLFFYLYLSLFLLPAAAAELPVGNWSGTYSFAKDDVLQVSYRVEIFAAGTEDESVAWAITMNAAGVAIKFTDIQLNDDQLRFRMNPGEEVECLLNPGEGGIFKGECSSLAEADEEPVIKIFMRPPQTESENRLKETVPPASGKSVTVDAAAASTEADEPSAEEMDVTPAAEEDLTDSERQPT